jgi:hypothetical protein
MRWLRYPGAPDRLRRMAIFVDAYGRDAIDGPTEPADLAASVIGLQRAILASDTQLAIDGVEPQATWAAGGHLDTLRRRIAWSEAFAATIAR